MILLPAYLIRIIILNIVEYIEKHIDEISKIEQITLFDDHLGLLSNLR